MFDRPPLTDDRIAAALEEHYDLPIQALEFLALGHDARAWTFRAVTGSGEAVFVKIRRRVDAARLRLVRFLRDQGLDAIVAPIAASDGALSVAIDELRLIAYPFVNGGIAAELGLDDRQWVEYGRIVGALHATPLTAELQASLPAEQFRPAWISTLSRLCDAVGAYRGDDPVRLELVAFWQSHGDVIDRLTRRAETLGRSFGERLAQPRSVMPFVPCHADIHTHNLLVDEAGALRVIDWDESLMAPRERDLMFVIGSPIGLAPGERELALFTAGYGKLDVDPELLAYYHTDWATQDILGYAEQVVLDDIGSESRAYALRIFVGLFEPGDEVEVALRFDRALESSSSVKRRPAVVPVTGAGDIPER
jgi:spectinomycin phosphotransferase